MAKKILTASVNAETLIDMNEIAVLERRSLSSMVDIFLQDSIKEYRNKNKKPKK